MVRIENTRNKKQIIELLSLMDGVDLKKDDGGLFENGLQYLIGFVGEEPIGICLLFPVSDETLAADIAIRKEWRGKIGYQFGKKLLAICHKFFNTLNIVVGIECENKASIRFCKHLGFKKRFKFNDDIILEYNYGCNS